MGIYSKRILPHVIDHLCGHEGFHAQRAAIVPQAAGTVLEVGVGTGRNLPLYDLGKVSRVIGLDPCETSLKLAAERAAEVGLPFEAMSARAEHIPLPDDWVDCVVLTYTLCSVQHVARALSEIRRVLRPDGVLLFCEHVRSPRYDTVRWQHRLEPLNRWLFGGCRLTRDSTTALRLAGFRFEALHEGAAEGLPGLTAWQCRGRATPAKQVLRKAA